MHLTLSSWLQRLAVLGLSLMLCAASGRAATTPVLNNPRGLAIDSKGNLYVANYGGNEVLVYNSNYVLIKKIKQGISAPTGVAFDPYGNLWVANYGAGGSVTEYSPAGVQNTAATITNGIFGPGALAIDGLGDIWVENDYINITMYDANGVLVHTFNPPGILNPTGLATLGPTIAFGGTTQLDTFILRDYFTNGTGGLGYGGIYGFAIAFDSHNGFYESNYDNTVWYATPTGYAPFKTLAYVAAGIAVDNTHGRVYFANQNGNSIDAYSTVGTLLHTIQ